MARAVLRFDIAPLVFHRRTGPRTNSVVEDSRGHDGRRMTRFPRTAQRKCLHLRHPDARHRMQPMEIFGRRQTLRPAICIP